MIARVLSAGLLAGFFAGLAIAALQNYTTTPLIIAAEVFEDAGAPAAAPASWRPETGRPHTGEARLILVHSDHKDATAGNAAGDDEEWAPADGLERIAFTSMATIAAAIGFAFLLLGGMLAAGDGITERRAMVWAAAGFVATGLAPAAGLSPELPGMAAADVAGRQSWWFVTATLTALSIWLFLRSEGVGLRVLAVLLLIAPHVWGAPHPVGAEASRVPAELAARFAATSLAVHAALWIATGFAAAFFWQRLGGRSVPSSAAT
jgi:cobalt transporter subunit CbtA